MIPRTLAETLRRLAQSVPVVASTGPRQSGKTTLARAFFADKPYVSLEDPVERACALKDPRGFLARFEQGVLFDEAQRWPDLFSYLQGMVDVQPAGRVGLTRLLPLARDDLPAASKQRSMNSIMLLGGYPVVHTQPVTPADWFASYVATYLDRDVRQVLNVQDLGTFQRFLRLCAGRSGQLLKLSALAGEAGISHSTARAWLSVLESSDLVFLLPPWLIYGGIESCERSGLRVLGWRDITAAVSPTLT